MADRAVVSSVALNALLVEAARLSATDLRLHQALMAVLGSTSPARPGRLAVSIREATELFGMSESTVRRRIADGTIRSTKVGGRVLIDPSSVTSRQGSSGAVTPLDGDPSAGDAVTSA